MIHKHEEHKRSIFKALSWRLTGTLTSFLIALAVSKSVSIASQIASLDFLIKTLLYYWHERAWLRIPLGLSDGLNNQETK